MTHAATILKYYDQVINPNLTMLSPGCDWVVMFDMFGGFEPFMIFINSNESPSYCKYRSKS